MGKSGEQHLSEFYHFLDQSGDTEACLARYPDLADEIRGYAVVRQFVLERFPDGPDPQALATGRALLVGVAGQRAARHLLPRLPRLQLAGAAAAVVLLAGAAVTAGAATGGTWVPGPVTRVLVELGIIHRETETSPASTTPGPAGAFPEQTASPGTPSPTGATGTTTAPGAAAQTVTPTMTPSPVPTEVAGGVANSAITPAAGEDRADLQVTKRCEPDVGQAGQPIHCSVSVENQGPSEARAIVLEDTMQAAGAVQVTGVAATQGSCDATTSPVAGGQKFACALGALVSHGDPAVVTYDLLSSEGQEVSNAAVVRSDTPDPDSANNTAAVNLSVTAVADLALSVAAPASVTAGMPISWTITATNPGPSTGAGVVIVDAVPAGVTVTSVTAPGGSCLAGTPGDPANPATCAFDSLAPGAAALSMTIEANVDATASGTLHNQAQVSSDTFDPDAANNLAGADTAVETTPSPTPTPTPVVDTSADLALTATSDSPTYRPSSTVHYRLTVTNNGPSDAVAVVVTVQLPPPKTGYYVSDTGGCTLSNTTLTCQLGTLAAGASVQISVDYFVQGNKGTVTVVASVSSLTADPVAANNSAPVSVVKG